MKLELLKEKTNETTVKLKLEQVEEEITVTDGDGYNLVSFRVVDGKVSLVLCTNLPFVRYNTDSDDSISIVGEEN
jgi:hypothetical protein